MRNIKKKIGYLIILVIVSASVFQIFNMNTTKIYTEGNIEKEIQTSAQESYIKQWIENPDFSTSENWTSAKGELGDPDDVDAIISGGTANYTIHGESGLYSISGVPNSTWTAFDNPDWGVGMDEGTERGINDNYGCWVDYTWDEGSDQTGGTPSVHWKRNITLPVNMSDYKITSASLNVTFNATVTATDPGGIDVFDDKTQLQVGDYARFYVLISDIENLYQPFQVANNRTKYLGWDTGPVSTIINTSLTNINEALLINYLELILGVNSTTFTITLGIDIFCEDNVATTDVDTWNKLRINFINLTFTYERKINQLTSVSWNQEGDKPSDISSDTVVVNEALLNFKYMINDTWPSSSPNSEIQVLINGMKHSETINILDEVNTTFQDAKLDGFDVAYLIEENENINLSIQVYLADDFELNRTIAISIDNVSLDISYTVYFDDYQTNLQLFLNGEDKTLSPSTELPIGQNLTVTVKYTNQTGGHIPGADIQLTGVGIIETLDENANNYSITINATQKLSLGTNYLNIEAKKTNYETQPINPTITIRKILGEITTVSGVTTINIDVGQNAQLEIMLNDTDNDELIRGAIVTYTWDRDSIPRVLTETNGIYRGEIEDPPEGLYTITISVFAGEDYEFEDLPITLNVGAYVPGAQPDLGWLIYVLIGAMIGLVVVFTLYQTHFKYPPMVRKIRKLKKNVKKAKKTKPIVVDKREDIINADIEDYKKILISKIAPTEKIEKLPIKKEEEI